MKKNSKIGENFSKMKDYEEVFNNMMKVNNPIEAFLSDKICYKEMIKECNNEFRTRI